MMGPPGKSVTYGMKKIIALCLLICFSGMVSGQTGETKGWPSAERYAFITECIKSAQKGMSEDTARFYCYCMQFRVEEKYPDIAKAGTGLDLETPEWRKEIETCLAGFWETKDRNGFLAECINSAKGGLGEVKAKNYCECMLYKVEVKFPVATDATAQLTAETLGTPEWKKIIQSCLEF